MASITFDNAPTSRHTCKHLPFLFCFSSEWMKFKYNSAPQFKTTKIGQKAGQGSYSCLWVIIATEILMTDCYYFVLQYLWNTSTKILFSNSVLLFPSSSLSPISASCPSYRPPSHCPRPKWETTTTFNKSTHINYIILYSKVMLIWVKHCERSNGIYLISLCLLTNIPSMTGPVIDK